MNYKIITDAGSDLSKEDELRFHIQVLPFQVTLGEESFLTRVDLDNEAFYDRMESSGLIPQTSQITPFQFEELYEQEADAGVEDLILILMNSKGSATYGNSLLASQLFYQDHPELQTRFRIHSYDGQGYSALYGAVVVDTAKRLEAGEGLDSVLSDLQTIFDRRRVYFGMYTLKYAAKSGRIPGAAAFLGDKLGLKPVMHIAQREISTVAKCRGERAMLSKITSLTAANIAPGTPYQMIYGCDRSCTEEAARLLTEALGYPPESYYQIGPVIAANAGPKVVGVAFTTKE